MRCSRQLIDSDFAGGVTDTEGWVFRGGYAPVQELDAQRHLLPQQAQRRCARTRVGQTDVDYDRLQLDFNVKF